MNKGWIKIIIERKSSSIIAQLTNGTVWLNQYEIADLLNVFTNSVEIALKNIFKEGFLQEDRVTLSYSSIMHGKEYRLTHYNMEVLIHLCFRIQSKEAEILRKFIFDSMREKIEWQEMLDSLM